jgi:hypothetical protein
LKQLKTEKERKIKMQALKDAGIDPEDAAIDNNNVYFEDDVIA